MAKRHLELDIKSSSSGAAGAGASGAGAGAGGGGGGAPTGAKRQMYLDVHSSFTSNHHHSASTSASPLGSGAAALPSPSSSSYRHHYRSPGGFVVSPLASPLSPLVSPGTPTNGFTRLHNNRLLKLQKHKGISLSLNGCSAPRAAGTGASAPSSASSSSSHGGFLDFQASHPSLCESKTTCCVSTGGYKCPPLTSMSQPCMSAANVGPTKILPFLYLGSQHDALTEDTTKHHGITYVLNVSTTCPKPASIPEANFLRIPVNDNHCDKLQPFFVQAFQFLDKVREAGGCVLVHCLAGISRSPTLAIAFVMRHLGMTTDEAYKYVKDKRPTISPNFNFMGQLLAYEMSLKEKGISLNGGEQTKQQAENLSPNEAEEAEAASTKKPCLELRCHPGSLTVAARSPVHGLAKTDTSLPRKAGFKPFHFKPQVLPLGGSGFGSLKPQVLPLGGAGALGTMAQSPTTALSKLSFASSHPSPLAEEAAQPGTTSAGTTLSRDLTFPSFPTTSLDKVDAIPCFALDSLGKKGANKRPLSASVLNISIPSAFGGSSSTAAGSAVTSAGTVTLRSPEVRAKRQTVRPNSIAFSSYPIFDLTPPAPPAPPASSAAAAAAATSSSSGTVSTAAVRSSATPYSTNNNNVSSTTSVVEQRMSCGSSSTASTDVASGNKSSMSGSSSTSGISVQCSDGSTRCGPSEPLLLSSGRVQQQRLVVAHDNFHLGPPLGGLMEQVPRKSRSLEDILNSPEEDEEVDISRTSAAMGRFLGGGSVRSTSRSRRGHQHPHRAVDMLCGQPLAGIHQSCTGHAGPVVGTGPVGSDIHQSNSSISSAGSHGSLHGSLEVIQVS